MRTTRRLLLASLATAAVTGCDHTADPAPPPTDPEPTMATREQIAAYRDLVDSIDEALQNYQFAILDRGLTQSSCRITQAHYDAIVRPAIGRMMNLGDEMEAFMYEHDGAFVADMKCVPRLMIDELDDHNNIACMWPTADANRAESLRHAGAMTVFVGHVDTRVEEMLAGMNGAPWTWHDSMCH